MIAGFPMYDRPEMVGANDRYWSLIRDALSDRRIAAPDRLTRGIDEWKLWLHPELVLAQTCGLPYRIRLHGNVRLVATPIYDLPCEPGYYFSVIIARADDSRSAPAEFDGARLAFNGQCSQSGWAAPLEWASRNGIGFGTTIPTGSHAASSLAVAEGRADLAAIDALNWNMMKRWDSHAADLREVARTIPTPALPYICANGSDGNRIWQAMRDAEAELRPEDRITLGLRGITRISPDRYLEVANPPQGK